VTDHPRDLIEGADFEEGAGMALRFRIQKALNLVRYPSFVRAALRYGVAAATEHLPAIRFCAANSLLDAGANKGQFSLAFHTVRPSARIIAFEPLKEAADTYEQALGRSGSVQLHRVALGASEQTALFHLADRDDSSSLLKPGLRQEQAFGVHGAGTIEVSVRRLSDCVDIAALSRPILLKVDVQGGELGVLQGCDTLGLVDYIYVELSFVELYENQPLFRDVVEYLESRGFAIAGVFNQVMTSEFGPTQADVLFRRMGGTVPDER
jgi:FkbM family methyltransferase